MSFFIDCLKKRYTALAPIDFNYIDQGINGTLDINAIDNDIKQSFTAFDKVVNAQLLSDPLVFQQEYKIACQQLSLNLAQQGSWTKAELREQLLAALFLNHLLRYLSKQFFQRNVAFLKNQRYLFKRLLTNPSKIQEDLLELRTKISWAQNVRDLTAGNNKYRLFINRLKRLAEVIALLTNNLQSSQDLLAFFAQYITPFLCYAAAFFFIPRFLVNTIPIVAHTFCISLPFFPITIKEKDLDASMRFKTQLQLCWTEFGNDGPWIAGNFKVLICMISPFNATLVAFLFAYDILIAYRAYRELGRLRALKACYAEIDTPSSVDFQRHIDQRIQYESRRLKFNLCAAVGVFIGACGALTLFATSPCIPLIGAILLVTISMLGFLNNILLEKSKPMDAPEKLPEVMNLHKNLGFFSSTDRETSQLSLSDDSAISFPLR